MPFGSNVVIIGYLVYNIFIIYIKNIMSKVWRNERVK